MDEKKISILFATSNKNKVSEAKSILEPAGFYIEQLLISGKPPNFIEPKNLGIEQVAISKIRQANSMLKKLNSTHQPILVEDSGIFIHSLDGFPGAKSSEVEKEIGIQGILKMLEGVDDRRAEYRAVAIIDFGNMTIKSTGVWKGKISKKILGNNGFGYDPIFIPNDCDGRTCGEMEEEEKDKLSHRNKALKNLSREIKSRQSE